MILTQHQYLSYKIINKWIALYLDSDYIMKSHNRIVYREILSIIIMTIMLIIIRCIISMKIV